MMSVSVVICHHKGDLILDTIATIPQGVEIIVVTSEQGRTFPGCLTYHTSLNNPAHKRNIGAYWAKGEFIAFLDDDVELCVGCLERMVEVLRRDLGAGIVYATTFLDDDDDTIDSAGGFMTKTGFIYEPNVISSTGLDASPVFAGKSAVCMVRAKHFPAPDNAGIVSFDEDFCIYGEESDLSWRLWIKGYSSLQAWQARAFHHTNKDKGYYIKRNIHFHGCKNYLMMLIKNVDAAHWYLPVVNAFIWNVTAFLFLFRNPRVSLWIWEGMWWVLRNFKAIWRKRALRRMNNAPLFRDPPCVYYVNRLREYLTHQLHHGGAR